MPLTNSSGTVYKQFSYDPWGRRRSAADWANYNVTTEALFTRGYTGHEHIDGYDLINMNGRMYDPRLGRMLSADPFTSPGTQGMNRYSYVLNNPLKYTDPSGYYWQEVITGSGDKPKPPSYDDDGNRTSGGGSGYSNNFGRGANYDKTKYYGGPGYGGNGTGLNGYYFDWYSGQYRSAVSGMPVDYATVYMNAIQPNSIFTAYFITPTIEYSDEAIDNLLAGYSRHEGPGMMLGDGNPLIPHPRRGKGIVGESSMANLGVWLRESNILNFKGNTYDQDDPTYNISVIIAIYGSDFIPTTSITKDIYTLGSYFTNDHGNYIDYAVAFADIPMNLMPLPIGVTLLWSSGTGTYDNIRFYKVIPDNY